MFCAPCLVPDMYQVSCKSVEKCRRRYTFRVFFVWIRNNKYTCVAGITGFLCFKCHQSLLKEAKPSCPICREPLAGRRSLVLENMAEKLPKIACKFDGCNFKKSEEAAVKKHEESCEYRLVPCDHCQSLGSWMQID